MLLPEFLSTSASYDRMVQLVIQAQVQLQTGLIPECSTQMPGQPFSPTGLRCLYAGCKMDLKAKRVLCRYKQRNYQSNFICEHCLACKHIPGYSYADFRQNAGWLATLESETVYRGRGLENPFLGLPGWSRQSCFPDMMHTLFHAGFASHVIGSMLKELCWAGRFGSGSIDDMLVEAHSDFVVWSGNTSVFRDRDRYNIKVFTALKLHMVLTIRTRGYPANSSAPRSGP